MGKGGEPTTPLSTNGLREDAAYAPFFRLDFNATDFASEALANSHTTAQAQAHKLQERVEALQLALKDEVLTRRTEVLQQAAQLRETEAAMQGINLAVDTVQAALQRAQALVMKPYAQVQQNTLQLRNVHSTVELLRHVIQRLKLVTKLKAQLNSKSEGGYQDLAKVAKLLADIEVINGEADLTGIDAVGADNDFLKDTWQQAQSQAEVPNIAFGLHTWPASTIDVPVNHITMPHRLIAVPFSPVMCPMCAI